ncbi:glutamate--tRNA ligase [candidate division KSB1 bacterium]|nr:glutamate--tRNA ligase [candidate division KSB1 bacterium]NIR72990.1 glutamate--tRNA ligase [candidate division KSB1 bacterium]NIS27743.1 glutamate--tRNA ligase [candidate division KSB1 bacterium]NIT74591.1 glutamate--tRNA ligase [candidate division KSB1 bacterium]NIU28410.1 glutamate--tRNA ligase [candidate division KSB1 bacterium]
MIDRVNKPRVRFAPSPTGYLHVGSARTAIFNWLFARKHQGRFLLRIEDTDVARSGLDMVEAIFSSLRWLGLNWDEEPIFQSRRFEIYQKYAEQMVADNQAYKCFCTKEKLQAEREKARKEKRTFRYDRTCLRLSDAKKAKLESGGAPHAVRLKVDEGRTAFFDEVFGDVQVDHEQLDDFIILRSDGKPTYHLAVVVDDHEMEITHVIRGDDHLSNTPKHILLYNAFGWETPKFVHLPLILGPDRQRLSKRHGATAVSEYKTAGYLPEAMFNFLALLGWSSGDDRESFSRDQLIEEFDLSGIMKKSAVFDERKLEWMNNQYIMARDDESLLKLTIPRLEASGLVSSEFVKENKTYLLKIMALLKPRMRRLSDFPDMASYFFRAPESYDEKAVKKHWKGPDLVDKFHRLIDRLGNIEDFHPDEIETAIRSLAEELDMSAAKLIHPTRVALTGAPASPGLFEVMELLGKDTVIRRLEKAVDFVEHHLNAEVAIN